MQIGVPTRDRRPQASGPVTEVFRFDSRTFEVGLSNIEAVKHLAAGLAGSAEPCALRHDP